MCQHLNRIFEHPEQCWDVKCADECIQQDAFEKWGLGFVSALSTEENTQQSKEKKQENLSQKFVIHNTNIF